MSQGGNKNRYVVDWNTSSWKLNDIQWYTYYMLYIILNSIFWIKVIQSLWWPSWVLWSVSSCCCGLLLVSPLPSAQVLGVSCVSARIWFLPYSSIQTRFNHVQAGKSCSLENLVFGRDAFFWETLKREGYGSWRYIILYSVLLSSRGDN